MDKNPIALGVAAAKYWAATTGMLFTGAAYHEPDDPLARVLAYLEFRRSIISGATFEYT